jgi:hypothetical protein
VTQKRKASDARHSLLPIELQEPLAISTRLLAPQIDSPLLTDREFPDPKSGSITPNEYRSPLLDSYSRLAVSQNYLDIGEDSQ